MQYSLYMLASVGINFGLIEMQIPEKYKENLDVSSEGHSSVAGRIINRINSTHKFCINC